MELLLFHTSKEIFLSGLLKSKLMRENEINIEDATPFCFISIYSVSFGTAFIKSLSPSIRFVVKNVLLTILRVKDNLFDLVLLYLHQEGKVSHYLHPLI